MAVERLVARVVVEERTVAGVKAIWAATARAAGATGAGVSEAGVAAGEAAGFTVLRLDHPDHLSAALQSHLREAGMGIDLSSRLLTLE